MKRIVYIFIAAILCTLSLSAAPKPGDEAHVLTKEWEKYQSARYSDLPSTRIEILEDILGKAEKNHYCADFYDAIKELYSSHNGKNWKNSDSLWVALTDRVKRFSEPIIYYCWNRASLNEEELKSFLNNNESVLKRGRHSFLYSGKGLFFDGFYVKDDYEFILSYPFSDSELKDYLGDSYPNGIMLDIDAARKDLAALKSLETKLQGKALSLIPAAIRLDQEFSVTAPKKENEPLFVEFKHRLDSLQKLAESYKRDEPVIVEWMPRYLSRSLQEIDDPAVFTNLKDGKVEVLFRNTSKTTLRCSSDRSAKKTFWSKKVENTLNSYYALDTVIVDLPPMDDGRYYFSTTQKQAVFPSDIAKYTISASYRWQKNGIEVYATDYKTGKPLTDYTLSLMQGDKVLESVRMSSPTGLFVRLPGKMQKMIESINSKGCELVVSLEEGGIKRKSDSFYIDSSMRPVIEKLPVEVSAGIFRDCGAYNPGDEVHFKLLTYESIWGDAIKAGAKGRRYTAKLLDPMSKEVASLSLVSNEFGSADGTFAIPSGLRNGSFTIIIEDRGRVIATDRFRVDEFLLPSYEILMDKDDKVYAPGDTVTVSGRIVSYSGFALSDATVTASLSNQSVPDVNVEADGRFSFCFIANRDWKYSYSEMVKVKVTASTGETIQKIISITVGAPSLIVSVGNKVESHYEKRPSTLRGEMFSIYGLRSEITVSSRINGLHVPYDYAVYDEHRHVVLEGKSDTGSVLDLQLPDYGTYSFEITAEVGGIKSKNSAVINAVDKQSDTFNCQMPLVIVEKTSVEKGEPMEMLFGVSDGPVWAVATISDNDGAVLLMKQIKLDGSRGSKGSQKTLSFEYKPQYPDDVVVNILFFKDGWFDARFNFSRASAESDFSLAFSSFRDKSAPQEQVEIGISANPSAEVLASVYDKSTESVSVNRWRSVDRFRMQAPSLIIGYVDGRYCEDDIIPFALTSVAAEFRAESKMMVRGVETENVAMEEEPEGKVTIRKDFRKVLAFEPFLRPDEKGNVKFSFVNSDKLSTYIVKVFAHDKDMNNAQISKEFVVSSPLQVSVAEPKYLYDTDKYVVLASVASNEEVELKGKLYVSAYAGTDYENGRPEEVLASDVTLAPHASSGREFPVSVPAGCDTLGLKVVFVAEGGRWSDGVFVCVPVKESRQSLTEAHSALLMSGSDKDALVRSLRDRFVNIDATDMAPREISLLDMIKEMVGKSVAVNGKDVISLSKNYYSALVGAKLNGQVATPDKALLDKVLSCRNTDGGFAWFEGMQSSPVMTAVVLERFARLRESGFEIPDLTSSVKYLDSSFTAKVQPWFNRISMAQYMYVRSLYAGVSFKGDSKSFEKAAREYLIPGKSVGLQGQILSKVRRVNTVENLLATSEGKTLARAWGLGVLAQRRMARTVDRDIASLRQYAVRHADGGYYYPNAVMPWRGLLESEAYAHAQLCRLWDKHDPEIAEGIRLWLMIQKETQDWKSGADFVDVVAAVLEGTPKTLDTKVVVLSADYTKPFSEIRASGNDMTLSRRFFRDAAGKDEIREGEELCTGDRVYVHYEIWSKENRSYVCLTAPREASLRPVDQLSGYRWGQGYKNVKTDRTEYYFESFPEEKTTIVEEFFVTQKGAFVAPACTIETIYAPHYRANAEHNQTLQSR